MSDVFRQPDDAATPLSEDETRDLIPSHIAYRRELNDAEQANIARGQEWALRRRRRPLLSETFIRALHRQMFGDVWRWAGRFRQSPRNLGIDHWEIPTALRVLRDDAIVWIARQTYPPDEIAIRLHHRLVQIRAFPNGNGRHARLVADLLALQLGRARFSWGSASLGASLGEASQTRARYIAALRAADDRVIAPLLDFARS